MEQRKAFFNRLLDKAQRRFVRSRSGSVLILVVALLVLMALIGTAYMSMAQDDRVASAQHKFNTEVELLVEGMVNLVKGEVAGDVFSAGLYRKSGTNYSNTTGTGMDQAAATILNTPPTPPPPIMPVNPGTEFVADRVPSVDNIASPATVLRPSGNNPPYWRFISAPLIGTQYESPFWDLKSFPGPWVYGRDLPTTAYGPFPKVPQAQGGGLNARMAPVSITLNGVNYPALQLLDAAGNSVGPPMLAADTDGDGVADAGLVKLPIGAIDGITYYVGTRIVDNAAAVNANIAWQPNGSAILPGDFFPTNIDLQGMLNYNDIPAMTYTNPGFVNFRFHGLKPGNVKPFDDYSFARNDFGYTAGGLNPDWMQEAAWLQLGRRLENPGFARLTPAPTLSFQALPLTETLTLADKFCLSNPNMVEYPSKLEEWLPHSMTSPVSQPYSANFAPAWFNGNFFYDYNRTDPPNPDPNLDPRKLMPLRALFVTHNPVTNFIPSKYNDRGQVNLGSAVTTPAFGDVVTVKATTASGYSYDRAYVYIGPTGVAHPNPGVASPAAGFFWVPEPWRDAPTKVSAETATFGQLMTAFWSVMADPTQTTAPVDGVPLGTGTHQFYSPLRDPNSTAGPPNRIDRPIAVKADILPKEVIKLRAAIAAVQTMDLRSPNYDVSSEKILLRGGPTLSNRLLEATVYGTQPQPYITAVYAENDNANKDPDPKGTNQGPNPQGYVGVQLYNPYTFPIDLTHWKLGIIQGRKILPADPGQQPYPTMKIVGITTFTEFTNPSSASQAPIIPPHKLLVLENYNPSGGGTAKDAKYRANVIDPAVGATPGTPPLYYYVPNLSEVMRDPANLAGQPGGELVLLRPHRATLTGGTMVSPANVATAEYDDTKIYDQIPVDSFDFFGMNLAATGAGATFTGIYYSRELDPATPTWKFVYPGRWDATKNISTVGATYRQEGIDTITWNAMSNDVKASWSPAPTVFGTKTTSTYPNKYPGIQLKNMDFAGPHPAVAAGGNKFPFGGFPRNGDLFEIPFIGAYRIRFANSVDLGTGKVTLSNPGNPQRIVELNSVTADSQQADDYDTYSGNAQIDDQAENIGRFTPIDGKDVGGYQVAAGPDDFAPLPPGVTAPSTPWRYHWGMQLLDYLTVQSPQDDQFPQVDPATYPSVTAPPTNPGIVPQPIVHSNIASPAPQTYGQVIATLSPRTTMDAVIALNPNVVPTYLGLPLLFTSGSAKGEMTNVASITQKSRGFYTITFILPGTANPTAAGDTFVILGSPDETASLHGLINVNTASWKVLAAVPFLPPPADPTNYSQWLPWYKANVAVAQAIQAYRDVNDGSSQAPYPAHGHGPFKNLFELNRVIVGGTPLRDLLGAAQTTDFSNAQGDLSPLGGTGDGVKGDFEGTFLMVNRISNLLTTRSDSFTAYIQVQGWRNAETANPTLVVQRRAAIYIDRSGVTPFVKTPTSVNIPTTN